MIDRVRPRFWGLHDDGYPVIGAEGKLDDLTAPPPAPRYSLGWNTFRPWGGPAGRNVHVFAADRRLVEVTALKRPAPASAAASGVLRSGGRPALAPVLARLGITSLSMNAGGSGRSGARRCVRSTSRRVATRRRRPADRLQCSEAGTWVGWLSIREIRRPSRPPPAGRRRSGAPRLRPEPGNAASGRRSGHPGKPSA